MEDHRLPGLPRYVRVNTLKIGRGAAEKALRQTGHFLCPDPKHKGHRAYFRDPHVPDLLVFKPKGQSDVSRIPMVSTGELVVQQRASCFPAVALAPPEGAHVIDGCAAPGNKTSHLAALMQNRGQVYAFEQNARRCELLREMMATKGASIVTTKHQSFLDADPEDPAFVNVTHILLDPSCSSSGMSCMPEKDPVRLRALADAQLELVLHAMKFPALEALVYSTCSVHEIENEEVVRSILHGQQRFGLATAMPWWQRRGHLLSGASTKEEAEEAEEIARCCVRTAYPDDRTIGFFLARFERREVGGDSNASTSIPDTAAQTAAAAAAALGTESANKTHEAKIAALARARAKELKRARDEEQRLDDEGVRAKAVVPQWRLERDAKEKNKRPKRN
jgi:putative methyltransferase